MSTDKNTDTVLFDVWPGDTFNIGRAYEDFPGKEIILRIVKPPGGWPKESNSIGCTNNK